MKEFGGIRVGDQCHVVGWTPARWPDCWDSRDQVTVIRMWEDTCQERVMVEVTPPLKNGATEVSIGWIEEYLERKR